MPTNRSFFLDKCSMYFTLKSLFKIPHQDSELSISIEEEDRVRNGSSFPNHSITSSSGSNNSYHHQHHQHQQHQEHQEQKHEEIINSKRRSWFFNRRNSNAKLLLNKSSTCTTTTTTTSTTHATTNSAGIIIGAASSDGMDFGHNNHYYQQQEQQEQQYKRKSTSFASSPSSPPLNNSSSLHRQIYSSSNATTNCTINSPVGQSSTITSSSGTSTTPENKRKSIFKIFSSSQVSSSSHGAASNDKIPYRNSVRFSKNNSSPSPSSKQKKKKNKANFVILIFIRGIWCEECVNYLQQLDKILWDKVSKEFSGNMAAIISGTKEQALKVKKQLNLRFQVVSDERMILAEKYNMNCVMKGSIVYNKVENMYKNRYMTRTGNTITDYLFEIIEFIDKKQSQNSRKKSNRKQFNTTGANSNTTGANLNNYHHSTNTTTTNNHHIHYRDSYKRDSRDAFSSSTTTNTTNTHNRTTIGSELNDISLIISDDEEEHGDGYNNVNNIEIDEKFIVEFFETKWKELFNVDNKLNTGFTQPGVLIINRNKKVIYSWKDGYSLTQQQEHVQQLILQQEILRQQEEQKTKELDNFLSEWDFNTWLNENSNELQSQNNSSLELNDIHKKHLSDEIKKAFRKTISNPSFISHHQQNSLTHHFRNSISQSSSNTNGFILNNINWGSKSPTTPSSSIGSSNSITERLKEKHSSSNDDVSSYPSGSLLANLQIAKASTTHAGIGRKDSRLVKRRPSSDPLKSFFREEIEKQEKLQAKEQMKKRQAHVSFNFVSSNNPNNSRSNLLIDRSFVEERIPPKHLLTIVEYYLSIQEN